MPNCTLWSAVFMHATKHLVYNNARLGLWDLIRLQIIIIIIIAIYMIFMVWCFGTSKYGAMFRQFESEDVLDNLVFLTHFHFPGRFRFRTSATNWKAKLVQIGALSIATFTCNQCEHIKIHTKNLFIEISCCTGLQPGFTRFISKSGYFLVVISKHKHSTTTITCVM